MTDKTPPTAHAEITAPISADLRRIEGASPVSQAVRLLREAAAELKNSHTMGGDWGDETAALDAYNEHMAVAATLEQTEAGQAVAAPATHAEVSKEQYARMFGAACDALGQISDHLGIDSDIDPGAEPIIEAIDELRAAALQAAPPAPAAVAVPDDFRGDTATLVRNIIALLELDAEGALVPHGVGGHARGLLSAAAARLAAAPAQAVAVPDETTPEYGSTDLGWSTFPPLADGEKRLMALITNLFGNDHQAFNDLDALVNRARLAPTTPAHKGE